MHERTLRHWLVIGFLACCCGPTLMTVGWIVLHQTDYFRRLYETRLSEQWGLPLKVGSIAFPRPRKWTIGDVSVYDSDGERILLTVARVDCWFGGSRDTYRWSQGTIDLRRSATNLRLLEQKFFPAVRRQQRPIELWAHQFTIATHQANYTVAWHTECRQKEVGPAIDHQLWIGSVDGNPWVDVGMRLVTDKLPTTDIRLVAHRPVPCSLLVPWYDLTCHLGERATIVGDLEFKLASHRPQDERNQDWRFAARQLLFEHVDLAALVRKLPYKWTGHGRLEWNEIEFAPGHLQAEARLKATDGFIDRGLLDALTKAFRGELVPSESTTSGGIAFQSLDCRVHLHPDAEMPEGRVVLQGVPADGSDFTDSILLYTKKSPAWELRNLKGVSLLDVVCDLLPVGERQVPAVREIQPLLSVLALPRSLDRPPVLGGYPGAKVVLLSPDSPGESHQVPQVRHAFRSDERRE